MTIYLLDLFFVLLMGLILLSNNRNNKQKTRFFLFIVFFLLSITLGFRAVSVGEDTKTYLTIAKASKDMSWWSIIKDFPRSRWGTIYYDYSSDISKIETLFLLINKGLMSLTNNTLYVQFIISCITCYGYLKFIKDNSSNVFLSVITFICEAIYINAFNAERQILASSVAINSYTCIKKKDYKKAFILIFIGTLIHFSISVFFVLLLIGLINDYKKGIRIIIVSGILILVFSPITYVIIRTLFPLYAFYLTNNYWKVQIGGTIVIWIVEILLLILIYLRKKMTLDDYLISCNVLIYLLLEIMGINFVGFSRLALLFRSFLILLFPNCIRFFKNNTSKKTYIVLICILLFLEFYSSIRSPSRVYSFGF